MRKNKIYTIILNDIVIATESSLSKILKEFDKIRKIEPKAYIQTYYC